MTTDHIGGYRAMPATGDRHAARLVFQSASVLADSALSINDGVLQPNGSRTALFWAADIAAVPPGSATSRRVVYEMTTSRSVSI
jgi:hypothetical protein